MRIFWKSTVTRRLLLAALALGLGGAAALAGAPAASASTPVLTFYLHPDGAPTWASHQIGTPCLGDPAMAWTGSITIITCRTGSDALWVGWSPNGFAWQGKFVASLDQPVQLPAFTLAAAEQPGHGALQRGHRDRQYPPG